MRRWRSRLGVKNAAGSRTRDRAGEGEPALGGSTVGRACPHTRVVVVGDRESDIYALLKWQAEHAAEAGLVVRATRAGDGGCRCGTRSGRQCCARWGRSRTSDVRTGRAVRIGAGRKAGAAEAGGDRVVHRAGGTAAARMTVGVGGAYRPQDAAGVAVGVERGGTDGRMGERRGWYEARGASRLPSRAERGSRTAGADALVKCLAFDAITASGVQPGPLRPRARHAGRRGADRDERQVIGTVVRAERLLPPAERGKPSARLRSWVVLLARMALAPLVRCQATRSWRACVVAPWRASCAARAP